MKFFQLIFHVRNNYLANNLTMCTSLTIGKPAVMIDFSVETNVTYHYEQFQIREHYLVLIEWKVCISISFINGHLHSIGSLS